MAPQLQTDTPTIERRTRAPGLTVAGTPVAPSVQTVLGTLRAHEPMTSADIQATTGLPRRTVYAALRTLRGLGVLMERPSLRDMRQSYVWLAHEAAVSIPVPSASIPHGMQSGRDIPANWVQVR
ncbi:MAG: helix-turn-helix domain-containing protein [Thermoplasmatota archaeon]